VSRLTHIASTIVVVGLFALAGSWSYTGWSERQLLSHQLLLSIKGKEPAKALDFLQRGADPNTGDYNGSALVYAMGSGARAVAEALIMRGAQVNAADDDGRTPLLMAAIQGDGSLVRVLLEHGATLNAHDEDGWTPLLGAVANGHTPVVRLLLQHGAETNARDNEGKTVLDHAMATGHHELIRLLRKSGAQRGVEPKALFSSRGGTLWEKTPQNEETKR
jgi:uncharacterized protein